MDSTQAVDELRDELRSSLIRLENRVEQLEDDLRDLRWTLERKLQ